jgi:hypothetical protein
MVFLLVPFAGCGGGGGGRKGGSSAPGTPAVTLVNSRAQLTWGASGGLPDGYLVEQSTDGATYTQIQTVTETSTFVDGLTVGVRYYFRVRSFNSTGNSGYSPTATVTL